MAKRQLGNRKQTRAPRLRDEWVHQFLIVLAETEPLVWRRIQVPTAYSFWDLHVAIQDAMGWLDCHLHEFRLVPPDRARVERLGIPSDEFIDEDPCQPDWKVAVSANVREGMLPMLYLYDFGDDWRHVVTYEGAVPWQSGLMYPRCVSGARKCPPEDCGGVHGYVNFLAAIADPENPDHATLLGWAGGQFNADEFDAKSVTFDDPRKRWKIAFEHAV